MALRKFGAPQYQSNFEKCGLQITNVLLEELTAIGRPKDTNLYNYQIEAALKTRRYFSPDGTSIRDNLRPCLIVAPTGSGKTGITVLLPYVLVCRKVLILSPSPLISKQLAEAFGYESWQSSFFNQVNLTDNEETFSSYSERALVVSSSNDVNRMQTYNLVIVNAQRFAGNSKTSLFSKNQEVVENVEATFRSFDTIIVDEAHHYPAKTWKAIVNHFRGKRIIFLTATPVHQDRDILPNQQITYEVTEAMTRGVTIRKCSFQNLKFALPAKGKLSEDALRRIGQEINKYLDEHDQQESSVKHKAMVLVTRKEEAKRHAEFLGNATYCTGATGDKVTDKNLAEFEGGKYRILVVCGKLLEGYDNKSVSICVILRRVESKVLFAQFIGRCLRTSFMGDPITAKIISHPVYNQQRMMDNYEKLAEKDPNSSDDEADAENEDD